MEIGNLLDEDRVLWHLPARSKLGSTGLGSGVAIPHGRVSGLEAPVGAFASLAQPIDFGSVDNEPVDLLFALLVPEKDPDAHLALLASLARMFSDPAFTSELRKGRTADELLRLLSSEGGRAPA